VVLDLNVEVIQLFVQQRCGRIKKFSGESLTMCQTRC